MSLFFLFVLFVILIFWVICSSPFSVVLFSLFIVPQYSNKPETIKTTNAPNHRNIGILAFPCPCQCLLKHFFGFAPFFRLLDLSFWCLFCLLWFHVFLLFSKQSLCFGLLLISAFSFWGSGEVARRATSLGPKPSLHLLWEEDSVQFKLFRSKIWLPKGDQILLLSHLTFVYSGFGSGNPVYKGCGHLLFFGALEGQLALWCVSARDPFWTPPLQT